MKFKSLLPLTLLVLSSCSLQAAISSSSEQALSSEPTHSQVLDKSENKTTTSSSQKGESSTLSSISMDIPPASEQVTDASFLELFAPQSQVSISISFPKASLEFIDQYQQKGSRFREIYVPADFTITINGQRNDFPEVGIRMKGNTSRTYVYQYGELVPVHFKISFKATFDGEEYDLPETSAFKKSWDADARKVRKKRNLRGLEKMDLKYVPRNIISSTCYAREIYCYNAFRDANIYAPYANICDLTFGDGELSYSGKYEIIESIDKEFLKKRLGKEEAAGDLYKCVYNDMGPADLARNNAVDRTSGRRILAGKIGVENDLAGYEPSYQLKTNDDLGENSDFSAMADYIFTMWKVVYDHAPESELNRILDVDEFLRFSAVSYLLGNFDDQRYNANNYYLYFSPSTKKAIYIPYDWDWGLGLGEEIMDVSSLSPLDETTLNNINIPNVYFATFFQSKKNDLAFSNAAMTSTYLQYISFYKDKVLNYSSFAALSSSNGNAYENEQIRTYMNKKSQCLA